MCTNCKYRSSESLILIVNFHNNSIVKEVKINAGNSANCCTYDQYSKVTYIGVGKRYSSITSIMQFDMEFNFIKNIDLKIRKFKFFSMKIINNLLYIPVNNYFRIYDLNMNYICSRDLTVLSEVKVLANQFSESIFITNLYDFRKLNPRGLYITVNKKPSYILFNLTLVHKNLFFSLHHGRTIKVYNIKSDFWVNFFENQLICKFDKCIHSMKEPYLLPCLRFACLKCICTQYNLNSNYLICSFCKTKHKYNFIEYQFLNEFINQNIKEIIEEQIKHARKLISYMGKLFEF